MRSIYVPLVKGTVVPSNPAVLLLTKVTEVPVLQVGAALPSSLRTSTLVQFVVSVGKLMVKLTSPAVPLLGVATENDVSGCIARL